MVVMDNDTHTRIRGIIFGIYRNKRIRVMLGMKHFSDGAKRPKRVVADSHFRILKRNFRLTDIPTTVD